MAHISISRCAWAKTPTTARAIPCSGSIPFPITAPWPVRVIRPGGELVHGQQIFLRRIDASSKYAETTTYANSSGELNSDEGWGENFSFDDVAAGYYEVEVRQGEEKFREEVWIYPYRTSFVEVTVGNQ